MPNILFSRAGGLLALVVCLGFTCAAPALAQQARFVRGDINIDDSVTLTDAIVGLEFLFLKGETPRCLDALDVDDDGELTISDPVNVLLFLFQGDAPPAAPFPDCGEDPSDDALDCVEFTPCPIPTPTNVVISEILARNSTGLVDGDGELSDWIELVNLSAEPVDLGAHFLTDDRDDLTKWAFHDGADTILPPGEFLVVIASGQETTDHIDEDGRFHTDFRLEGGGEFLGLVAADGRTILSSFSPRYPSQLPDVSYGIENDATGTTTLLDEDTDAHWIVADESLPANWTSAAFDDRDWSLDEIGFGYETEANGIFTGKFETNVETDLRGVNSSLHLRVRFHVEDPASVTSLTLWIRYTDGFVAWINGDEVARQNAPESPDWNATATADRQDSVTVGEFTRVPLLFGSLLAGENVLAVQAMSTDANGERFLILPTLEASLSGSVARFFDTPTPGTPNADGIDGRVRDTEFSVDRGYHEGEIDIAITTATPNTTIRYTTNGSTPTATAGQVYDGPISIDGVTVLRAAAFRDGWLPSDVDTHTYIFLEGPRGVLSQPDLPAGHPRTWEGFPADYGTDPEIANHPDYRDTILDDLQSLPVISIVASRDDLFGSRGIYTNARQKGDAWERPGSVEFFSTDGSEEFQVGCGVRLQGGAGRRPHFPKKSFRVVFRRRYGPSKLRYDIFGKQFYGEQAAEEFDQLSLRGGFNNTFPHWYDEQALNSQYVRDQWARDMQFEMGHRSANGRWAHLYVNGMYWGIYNVGERPENDFGASHFGGNDEDYDVIKNGSARDGNAQAWSQLISLAGGPVATDEGYATALEMVDAVNLIDYVIENYYFGNNDWDNHNWVSIRKRAPGEKFRFYAWDSEFAISLGTGSRAYNLNLILNTDRSGVQNNNSPTFIFHRLRQNAEFRLLVQDRVHRHCFNGGVLTPERAAFLWNRRAAQVDRAIVGESLRWGDFRRDVSSPRESGAGFGLLTRNNQFLTHRAWILGTYLPQRTGIALNQFRNRGYWTTFTPPEFSQHGGDVEAGAIILLTTEAGETYYATGGTDPRRPGGEVSPLATRSSASEGTTLLTSGGPLRWLVPASGDLGTTWTESGFVDGDWAAGTSGIGYERNSGYEEFIGTDVEANLYGVNTTIYVRFPFEIESIPELDNLTLRMRYDDGFVAYLNGVEIASANSPAAPAFDSASSASHPDSRARVFQNFDVTQHVDLLRIGDNVLAVHGVNRTLTSSDFLIQPELKTSQVVVAEIEIQRTTRIKARHLVDGVWSPLTEALFRVDSGLRVTELMYHPAAPTSDEIAAGFGNDDDDEFLEVANVGGERLFLNSYQLAGGVRFIFPGEAVLDPGERAVLVRDRAGFEERYGTSAESGISILGEYDGQLANDGENVFIVSPSGEIELSFTYDDAWHPTTDGDGHSLTLVDAEALPDDLGEATAWTPSAELHGSPGAR
jgi:hypothetical protein